jgi:hypothetical protein
MNRKSEYRQLMEQIRLAHQAFTKAWAEARTAALKATASSEVGRSWNEVWQANGIAYKSAQSFSEKRDRLIGELFQEHLGPLHQEFGSGDPDAVHAIIDFLEVDVPAFRCGYAKEDYLRMLKTIFLTDDHRERIRQYGLRLCMVPNHRREIQEAGRLMILVANRDFVDQLQGLAGNDNEWIRKKANKMLGVVQNGRKDLR